MILLDHHQLSVFSIALLVAECSADTSLAPRHMPMCTDQAKAEYMKSTSMLRWSLFKSEVSL